MTNNSKQKAVVQYALSPGAVELREMPVPVIGKQDVLLQVAAVSVCGSDVHQMHNTHTWPVNIPVILGHEFAGTVVVLGEEVKSFQEGDRVVSETAAEICGNCVPCRSGRYNLCPSRKGFGYGVHGAMTSFVRAPARCLHHIPDALPFYLGCLAEPCSVAYHAMCVNSTIRPGDSVVVIGPGPIGLLCLKLAALSGADPLVMVGLTADAARLETSKELGATHVVNAGIQDLNEVIRELSPLGADLVCDASGASGPLQAALSITAPDGQITKVGWSPKQAPLDINPLVQKNMHLQGSFSHTYPMWEKVISLMTSGRMQLDKIIGLKTVIDEWREAFDSMHQGKVIKSVLLPES